MMDILFGMFVWLFMCSSILILASLASRLEGEQEKYKSEGYIGYIEEVYSRNVLDQRK
ncbi:hypothetical protein SAMN04487943_108105 [Gracilibacillus orientalis]|uniref:Uncharacterized protein n=2 Tax=Gracilibacillus orientalis TaxID=334253 RepID=A0A1I4NBZ2_9BACI|nr:hypothetical protein SAMN04487943_108105 [Gracilibacillus orientalis]